MIALLALQLATAQPETATGIRFLAEADAGERLVAATRAAPDSAREALRRLFVSAASRPDSARAAIAAARRVAQAYAVAWSDSFLLRQLARFERWSPSQRRVKTDVDSLRLTGNALLGRRGPRDAAKYWEQSLRRAQSIGDSVGMAAAWGNLGAAQFLLARLDSAVVLLGRARHLAEAVGDHRTAGNALGLLGNAARERGDFHAARELVAAALARRALAGDERGAAADANTLGLIAQALGDTVGARRAFEDALSRNRSAGRDAPAAVNLVNLGNLAADAGDYEGAGRLYAEALGIYRARDEFGDAATVLDGIGLLALRRADYPAAKRAFTEAATALTEASLLDDAVRALRHLAEAQQAMGDYQGAVTSLRRAEKLADEASAGAPTRAGLALSMADLAVEFNNLTEADIAFRRAERMYVAAGDQAGRSAALQGRVLLAVAQSEDTRARDMVVAAQRAAGAATDRRTRAHLDLLAGYVRMRSDTATAARDLRRAVGAYLELGDSVMAATAIGFAADLELDAGRTLAAEELYLRGLALLGARTAPSARWPLYHGLGRARIARGARREGIDALRMALTEVEAAVAGLRLEERRSAFLADKWDVYADLAFAELASGATAAAFDASERLRARQLLDGLARGRVTPAAMPTRTAAEQDLRQRITRLTHVLESVERPSNTRGTEAEPERLKATREALAAAQQAYANLLADLKEADPRYADLVSGETVSWQRIASRLPRGTALVTYLVTDSTTAAFVVRPDGLESIDLGVGRRTLARLTEFARGTLQPPTPAKPMVDARASLRQLHTYLVRPIETAGLLRDVHTLLIAPHHELHYLPFGALVGAGDRYLVERYAIAYVPSGSTWLRLIERPRAEEAGDILALAPNTATLPGSLDEIQAIARITGRTMMLADTAATKRSLRDAIGRYDIVHLATYGVLTRQSPLFSHVRLAPDDADDGRLEVREVYGLPLRARLVVLSACQTALGSGTLADVPTGDDWIGLVRAFLEAGAGNVLATLWPVADRATARFMERLYQGLASGTSEVVALAEAQRAAIRDPSLANPFYWAGFAMFAGR